MGVEPGPSIPVLGFPEGPRLSYPGRKGWGRPFCNPGPPTSAETLFLKSSEREGSLPQPQVGPQKPKAEGLLRGGWLEEQGSEDTGLHLLYPHPGKERQEEASAFLTPQRGPSLSDIIPDP